MLSDGNEETYKPEAVYRMSFIHFSSESIETYVASEGIDMGQEAYVGKKNSEIYKHLREVTLSASDKNGHVESDSLVLHQRSYTGRVLPSAVANRLCSGLGVDGMLEILNSPVRTPESPLYKACEYFIAKNYDVGNAYAHLRRHPNDFDIDGHVTEVHLSDKRMRAGLLEDGSINKHASPRRVWDLHANRVMPYWVADEDPWAISHAWVADKDLKREMTVINGYQWPVPMPKDADLDLIRIEMLNLGAEYIWVDVLCLRQAGRGEDLRGHIGNRKWRRREALRKEEWKSDVPTIGWVYARAGNRVICYLSGLGLSLSFKTADDFEDERCWFNRVWTLQEIPQNPCIAGETCDNGDVDDRFMTIDMRRRMHDQLASLGEMQRGKEQGALIFVLLSHMQKQKSTKAVDKIAALVYLFHSKYIQIYNAGQSEEEAWTRLVNVSVDWFRGELFFLYPDAGSGTKVWRPSWQQVMEEKIPDLNHNLGLFFPKVHWTETYGDSYHGLHIDSCRVLGLADTSDDPRYGYLDIKDGFGVVCSFKFVADHAYPIDDGWYTVVCTTTYWSSPSMGEMLFAIGKIEKPEGKFRKVSVFRMVDVEEVERFKHLDVFLWITTYLL
ncbi:hypothetical protein F5146DRAFT_960093 [Armillaria mellea]|nr:hypothetical protein F5146DRAFT_960093 [Armillaria mellea]